MKEFIKHKFPYLFFLLLLSNFVVVYGQEQTVTLNMSKVPLSSVLTEIENKPQCPSYTISVMST